MSAILKFQIQHITSRRLQQELFSIVAPSLDIDWSALDVNDKQRAEQLAEKVKAFSNFDKRQHDALCSYLSVISTIGTDSKNTSFIEKEIRKEKLWDRYWPDDFGMPSRKGKSVHAKTTHNIACWICVLAHRKDPGDSLRKDQPKAERLWNRLCNMSGMLQKEESSYVFFLSETTIDDLTTRQRADAFCEAYKKYKTDVTGIQNYPAIADDSVHFEFVRYAVNMAPNPHLSVQIEGEDFDSKIDPNAGSFRIDHFPTRDYLRISRIDDKATSKKVAELFAEHALGAKILDENRRRYEINQFASREALNNIALPDENRRAKDEAWISALRCVYLDDKGQVLSKNYEYDFPYSEDRNIYQNIELGYPVASVAVMAPSKIGKLAACREILGVTITFHLHDIVPIGKGRIGLTNRFLPAISITVTPKSSDFLKKTRNLDPYHKSLIYGVLNKCDLLPKTTGQIFVE